MLYFFMSLRRTSLELGACELEAMADNFACIGGYPERRRWEDLGEVDGC
jgi:hypothetical protein